MKIETNYISKQKSREKNEFIESWISCNQEM